MARPKNPAAEKPPQSQEKRSSGDIGAHVDTRAFTTRILDRVPPWAMGIIGSLFALALVLKIIGIDFANPINTVTDAYAQAVEAQAQGIKDFDEATKRFEQVVGVQADQVQQLSVEFSRLLDRQDETAKKFASQVTSLDEVISGLNGRLEQVETDLADTRIEVSKAADNLFKARAALTEVSGGQRRQQDALELVDSRIDALEALSGRVDDLERAVGDLKAALEARITTLERGHGTDERLKELEAVAHPPGRRQR